MVLLLASIRLWTGRTDEAVDLADQALRAFTRLGDAYGTGQAHAVLGRAMVMVGRVEEGFALMDRTPRSGSGDGPTSPAEGLPGRMARFAASLQIGEPARGADVLAELAELGELGAGVDDLHAALALSDLQRGDAPAAADRIARSSEAAADPNVLAVRSLVQAALGAGDAAEVADRIERAEGATYLDLAVGSVAAALEAAAGDAGPAPAQLHLSRARAAVQRAEDRTAVAVVELAAAAVSQRLALDDAEEAEARAEHLLAKLGIDAAGWKRAFALALRTPVG